MHKMDKEKELRKLLNEKGSRSKQMRDRIVNSGACDMKLNGTKARGDSDIDTIWDRKRSEISEQEWIVSPLAAQADVVMADDKVRLKPIITLEKITRRPLALTLASQNPQNRNFDMVRMAAKHSLLRYRTSQEYVLKRIFDPNY